MSVEPVVVEELFPVPPAIVWRAVTDPEQMRQWFFETMEEFRPEPGFETEFDVAFEGRVYRHLWRIESVSPEREIVYRWRYGGISGSATVTWQVAAVPGGSLLRLVHEGHESFPQDVPEFTRESCEGGWNYFIRDRLMAFLKQLTC